MYRKPFWSSDDDDDEQDEVLSPKSRNVFKRVVPVDAEKTAKEPHLHEDMLDRGFFSTTRIQSNGKTKTSYKGFAPVVAEKKNSKVPYPRLGSLMGATTSQSYEPKPISLKGVTLVDVKEKNSKLPSHFSRFMRYQSERKLEQKFRTSRRQNQRALLGPYKIPCKSQSREDCVPSSEVSPTLHPGHSWPREVSYIKRNMLSKTRDDEDEEGISEVQPVSSKVIEMQPVFREEFTSHHRLPWSCDFIGPISHIKRNKLHKTHGYDGFVSSSDEGEEGMSVVSCYKFNKKPIGFGAFGTCVYEGVNTKDSREVAIKKINCQTRKQTHQYKREVKYLLLLSSCPNIVKYLDVVVEQNAVYIVLELMEGTLETLVNQSDRNINFTEVCQDIMSALHFLHNQSKITIHRDIKPRNILFVSSPRLKLKLADFGLSKMLESDSSSIGYNGGTRCWMAPEVHRSLDQFSTVSDIFATGLVLHYLMTSKHPFAPEDMTCTRENRLLVEHDIVHNILNHHLNVDNSLSPEAFHLINQMLNDDKDQRPNADKVLAHPFFWSNQKKLKFLEATANQPEIFERGTNDFKKDLEMTQLGAQFRTVPWSEQSDAMVDIHDEMMVTRRRNYNTSSVAGLLRFMRNAYQHVSQAERTNVFRKYLLKDFIFLKEFKSLVIDVYEVVLEHEWEQNKEEVMYAMS